VKRPTLVAAGFMVVFVAILAFPMLKGKWLAAPSSDQYASAYAVHEWQAEEWRATGHLPLWNPMIMDGLPYIAPVTHGDVLYPTSFLRWFLSADKVTNLGFVLHYILAGLFMFLFLRRLNVSWVGSTVGGLAYQLSGILISYARPGHDGKLFVSTMLPLACLALLVALRDRRMWGYPLLAVAVALCLVSPHVQTTYYLLIATGLWALYLTFGEPTTEPLRPRVTRLAIVLIAVIAGFGIAAPQILPFLEYIPHSPRAVAYSGAFEGAASFGIPWEHVPGFFLAGFVGESDTYWGSNGLKLHSEYLGLPVIALAILGLGFARERRRLIWWLGGIGVLFLLIALSNATPFYKLWWSVMPYVRKTRAPGMVFFIVAFCTAAFAAFGAERLERREGATHVRAWLVSAGIIALLGMAGVFGHLATAVAPPGRAPVAEALGASIRASAVIGAFILVAVALLAFAYLQGRVPALALAIGLPLLVGVDLWRDGRRFWLYSDPPNKSLYRPDAIVTRLRAEPKPYRVLNLNIDPRNTPYPENVLMAYGIPQVIGYQGNELRYHDELLGGRNEWRYLFGSTKLWDLVAARFVIIPDTLSVPRYHRVMGPVETAAGGRAYLYEADTAPPYARVVPAAVKLDADSLVPPTLADPRFPGYDRVVVLPSNSPVTPPPLRGLPPASPSRARVTAWDAGKMSIELEPAPRDSSYVLIGENWYLDWRVSIDGRPGQVLRGDHALLTIPVGPNARRLELSYYSRSFARGKMIALFTLVLVIAGFIAPPIVERRGRRA